MAEAPRDTLLRKKAARRTNGRRFGGRRTHTTDLTSTRHEKTPSEASDNPLCSTTAVCWPPIVEMCRIMSKNVIELSKAVEICRKAAQTVGEMAKGEESDKASRQWLAETRNRLAQRRGKRPATKAGQIRAIWPEIRAAIAEGQSLANIRQWLEEDGGSYLTRIRRKELANPLDPLPRRSPSLRKHAYRRRK